MRDSEKSSNYAPPQRNPHQCRRTRRLERVNQYQNNDLKYRYIKMQGKTNKKNIFRLERQFGYRDSVTIIRKQVEKYEELVREQAERIERARQNADEAEKFQQEVEVLKGKR
jgi:hypothetical protein